MGRNVLEEGRTTRSGAPYFWKYAARSRFRNVPSLTLSIEMPLSFQLSFERDRGLKRIANALSFRRSADSESPDFNQQIFILSPDAQLNARLLTDEILCKCILTLFSIGAVRIFVNDGKLSAKMEKIHSIAKTPGKDGVNPIIILPFVPPEPEIDRVEDVVGTLAEIKKRLNWVIEAALPATPAASNGGT